MKLNVKAFALTCALVWGIGIFLMVWWIMMFEGATHEVTLMGEVYRGFEISPVGSVFGLGWGLLDGLIGGAIFAWVYNFLSSKFS